MRKLLAGAALVASLATGSAQAATVLFSDNFDAEHGGTSALNYSGFANWTVTGQVDLVRQPDYGINCVTGSCVDLDGTSGPGAITSTDIAFAAGQLLTITFSASGNQRGGAADVFDFTALFGSATDITGFHTISGFTYGGSGDFNGLTSLGTYAESMNSDKPMTVYSVAFTPTQAGTLKLYFATPSGDNVGPIVDSVSVVAGAVPEPATWAMMIAGFGLAGATLRRRRAALAA